MFTPVACKVWTAVKTASSLVSSIAVGCSAGMKPAGTPSLSEGVASPVAAILQQTCHGRDVMVATCRIAPQTALEEERRASWRRDGSEPGSTSRAGGSLRRRAHGVPSTAPTEVQANIEDRSRQSPTLLKPVMTLHEGSGGRQRSRSHRPGVDPAVIGDLITRWRRGGGGDCSEWPFVCIGSTAMEPRPQVVLRGWRGRPLQLILEQRPRCSQKTTIAANLATEATKLKTAVTASRSRI